LNLSLSISQFAKCFSRFDFESEKADVLGAHEQTVSSVVFAHESSAYISSVPLYLCTKSSPYVDFLVTGSWDRSLRTWDHRQSNAHISSLPQPERVYAMDITGPMLVVATAGRFFSIYDVRKMEQPVQRRESSLKFQTRTVACMADGKGAFSKLLARPTQR
jgi:cell cycle arrest protein BUB3